MDEPPATDNLVPTHGIIRQWVDLYGPKSEAPVEGHLGAAIALISAAIGHKLYVQWARNREPCTVNVILEGQSASGRKTTTANTARELANEAVDSSDDEPGLRVSTIGHTSDRGLIELIAPQTDSEAARWEKTSPPGNLFVWDEFGPVLGDPGQNRKGSDWLGRTRKVLMDLTGGYQYGVKTGQVKLPASRCSVSILATVTREELEQRISMGLLKDGFMGRFALIPMNQNGKLLAFPPAWERRDMEAQEMIVRWLRGLVNRREPWGHLFDLFTDDAKTVRGEWYAAHKQRLVEGAGMDEEELSARSSAFDRLQTLAAKLAGILAVSQLDNPLDGELVINRSAAVYGQRMVDMMLAEVMDLASMSGPIADQYGPRVERFLAKQPDEVADRRALMRFVKISGMTANQRWAVIEGAMYQEGRVHIWMEKTDGRPRTMVKLMADGATSPSAPLPAQAVSPPHTTPNGTPSDTTPQTESETGETPIRHFRTPPRAHEGEGSPGENIHMAHTNTPDTDDTGETPPTVSVEGAGSPPKRRSTPDDDIPF